MTEKTHYRKAFDSPYLSAQDITEPTVLTIKCVKLELDKTKKTKDSFNTAYFAEREIRHGEELKPMILNATNSRTLKALVGTPFIDDWNNIHVTVYVDPNVKFGRDMVEGLRISTERPRVQKPDLPLSGSPWENAVNAYVRDGNFDAIEKRMNVSDETKTAIIAAAEAKKQDVA